MRSTLMGAVLVTAVLAMGSASFAAGTAASGVIKSLDAKAMTVTLEDGSVYTLPAGFKIDGFKAGEKVALTWELKGTVKDIETMTAS